MSIEAPYMGSGHPAVPFSPTQHLHAILASGDPEQVTTDTRATYNALTMYAYSGYNADGTPIANAGTIYVGFNEDDLSIVIEPGGSANIQSDSGIRKRLSEMWIKGTINDGLKIEYIN